MSININLKVPASQHIEEPKTNHRTGCSGCRGSLLMSAVLRMCVAACACSCWLLQLIYGII